LNYLRMDPDMFNDILIEITPAVARKDILMRQCIKPPERLQLSYYYTLFNVLIIYFSYMTNIIGVTKDIFLWVGRGARIVLAAHTLIIYILD